MELKVVELFAGVGGFRVGLNKIKKIDKNGKAVEDGDWDFVWANQWEPSKKSQVAYECYIARFGDGSCSNEDINKVDKVHIPYHSLLVGGFPCQDYSVARTLHNEKGIEGKKGVLFWDIVDVLKEKQPPFILLENVDRLLNSPSKLRGRDFAIMLKTLDELGYYVTWRIINAAEYSMPQKRKRVFIFAFSKNTKYAKNILKDEDKIIEKSIFSINFPCIVDENKKKTKDLNKYDNILEVSNNYSEGKFLNFGIMIDGKIIECDVKAIEEKIYSLKEIVNKAQTKGDLYILNEKQIDKFKELKGAKKKERTRPDGTKYFYTEGNMSFPENMDLPGRTMLTSESSVNRSTHVIYDEKISKYRFISENEAELLQMFPIDWTNTMNSKSRYFVMGNALVTGIVSRLEESLREIISNE